MQILIVFVTFLKRIQTILRKEKHMERPTRKERQQHQRKGCSSCWIFIVIFILMLALLLGGGYWVYGQYQSGLQPKDSSSEEVIEIELPEGSTGTQIAQLLEENGIISNARSFNLYNRLNDKGNFQAGYYQLSPSQSVGEIVEQLEEGGEDVSQASLQSIAIPEGSNILQVADIIEQSTSHSAEEVLELLENDEFQQELLDRYPELLTEAMEVKDYTYYTLEGYLYPATYNYSDDMTLEDIVIQMVDKADELYRPYFEEIEQSDFSLHEVLTLSSFIEREANNDEDRKLIASVFLNRLDIGMMLQTDVSVAYAKGEHLEYTTLEDADIDSPYNLYRNYGLGPGPVNNGSVNSVEAVLHPAESDYLYFLADIETEETYFSNTFEEHLEKQAIYVDGKMNESNNTEESESSSLPTDSGDSNTLQ